jgi:epoxyqueuosine reductase
VDAPSGPASLVSVALAASVRDRALSLGFDAVAFGPADPPDHGPAFARWLDAGHGGTLEYLARTRAERLEPERLLPGARSVVAAALLYGDGEPAPDRDPAGPRVARYARGRDYHDVMRPRLRELATFIDRAAGARSRAAVDTSAVLERDLAARAGLGWIGKNTNLLSPALGSYFFIGVVLTTAELPHDAAQPDRCGTCRACLDACPTAAFAGPWVLDARRCISYLTIEHRGPIDPALRPHLGQWLFGCDVCQEVCPWNRRAPATREPAFGGAAPDPVEVLAMDEAAFRARFRSTALWRARRGGLRRDAAVALGNAGDAASLPPLAAAAGDADPVVSDAARWALERVGARIRAKETHR